MTGGWLAPVLLLVEIMGVVNANAFEFGHQMGSNTFHFDVACGRYCKILSMILLSQMVL